MKARYIAKDRNRKIYLYSHKPKLDKHSGIYNTYRNYDSYYIEISPYQAKRLLGYKLLHRHGVVKLPSK